MWNLSCQTSQSFGFLHSEVRVWKLLPLSGSKSVSQVVRLFARCLESPFQVPYEKTDVPLGKDKVQTTARQPDS